MAGALAAGRHKLHCDGLPGSRGDHADARRGARRVRRRGPARSATRRPCTRAGRGARRLVEESRERIAAALGARPSEVIFTSGGTESDNLATKGIFWARRAADPRRNRVVASAVEHHAVLDAVEWLGTHEGAAVDWLPVDDAGRVDPAALAELLIDAHGDEIA